MSRRTTIRRTLAALGVAALALTTGACASETAAPADTGSPAASGGSASDPGSGAAGATPLSISATGVDSLPFMAILQVGIDKGWFAEAGVDVSLFSGGGGGNTLRVVTSGDADMAIAGNTSVLLAARQPDSNLTIVAPWFQLNDFAWIAPQGATLDGATLGFSSAGSSTELIIKALEEKLPVSSQAVGGMGDNWTAARAGQITAGWAMNPFTTDKVTNDGAEVLVESRDVIGDLPADLVAVNSDYAAANPAALTAFFEVADRLNAWVVDSPEEAGAALAPLLAVDADVMTASLTGMQDLAKGYSLQVDKTVLDNLSNLMVQAGQIDAPVDWATVLDQQYLPEKYRADLS